MGGGEPCFSGDKDNIKRYNEIQNKRRGAAVVVKQLVLVLPASRGKVVLWKKRHRNSLWSRMLA